MKSITSKLKEVHYLKLEKGDDILESVVSYCREHKISSGAVLGIGAVENPSLGYFDLDKKIYLKNDYDFNAEILNCTGNIAINAETGEYMAHLHMLVGDPKGHTFGGHLLPGNKITVTGEFVIIETEEVLTRSIDEEFKLLLLNLN
jgi:predicted DNA-binding protein with PD1-like motif